MIAALCAAHYQRVRDLGFLGHDTLPVVVASVVDSPADLARVVSEPHVGAPFWSLFYRPLLRLSFSLDHALFGFDARGYHATSALLLASFSAALFALARRTVRPSGRSVAGWVAMLVFLLHPVHVEVLPALERRGELLCGVFMILALFAQLSPRTLAQRRPAVAPALLTLAAVASKETAIVLPVLVGMAVWLWSPRGTPRDRLLHGAIAAVGPALAIGIAGIARVAVLGTLGGHDTAGVASLANSSGFARLLAFPQPVLIASAWIPFLPLAALAAVLVIGVVGARASERVFGNDARALTFGAAFTLILIAIHAYTGKTSRWYLLLPVAGWALLLGASVDALFRGLRGAPGTPTRIAAGGGLLAIGLLVAVHAQLSPIIHHYEEWPLAARSRDAYLAAIEDRVRAAQPGRILLLERFPNWVRFDASEYTRRPTVHTAAILRRDSLEAWLRITFPDKNVRVRRPRDGPFRPDPKVLLIVTDRQSVQLR